MLTHRNTPRKETNMKNLRFILFCWVCTLTLLCGCSKEKEMPEDNQANHGPLAIMETENGYYYNYGYVDTITRNVYCKQYLHYLDKENGENILVCNKPECEHNGNNSCTATYKNIAVINSLIYNNEIYVYGVEEDGLMVRFNLYRIAPDGSSIDKVGTVIESENTLSEDYNISLSHKDIYAPGSFIIHKGYAYLPYYLRLGVASKGFMGGGLVQMDITTGETKTIYEMEHMTSKFPHDLTACGDYVYMNMINYHSTGETTRYVISEDRLEPISERCFYDVFTETTLYTVQADASEESDATGPIAVNGYDVNIGELLADKTFLTDIPSNPETRIISFPYEDMLVIGVQDRVTFYGIGEENYSEKLGEIFFESGYHEEIHSFVQGLDFKISGDTLYRICTPINVKNYRPAEIRYPSYIPYAVYSCPIKDILKGNGQWTLEFTYAE